MSSRLMHVFVDWYIIDYSYLAYTDKDVGSYKHKTQWKIIKKYSTINNDNALIMPPIIVRFAMLISWKCTNARQSMVCIAFHAIWLNHMYPSIELDWTSFNGDT